MSVYNCIIYIIGWFIKVITMLDGHFSWHTYVCRLFGNVYCCIKVHSLYPSWTLYSVHPWAWTIPYCDYFLHGRNLLSMLAFSISCKFQIMNVHIAGWWEIYYLVPFPVILMYSYCPVSGAVYCTYLLLYLYQEFAVHILQHCASMTLTMNSHFLFPEVIDWYLVAHNSILC